VEISLGNSSIIKSASVGSVTIRTNRGYDLILSDVLHVPKMHLHILSTSALTLKGATVAFDNTGFALRHLERTIVDGHQNGSLYWLVGHQVLNAASSTASVMIANHVNLTKSTFVCTKVQQVWRFNKLSYMKNKFDWVH